MCCDAVCFGTGTIGSEKVFATFMVSWNVRSHGSSNGISEEPAASFIVVMRCDVAGLVDR